MADAKEKSMLTKAKEYVLGTPEQNKKAANEMKAQDKKTPDSVQAKINKVTNYGGYAKGGYVRAADGCAQRGKTRGKMV